MKNGPNEDAFEMLGLHTRKSCQLNTKCRKGGGGGAETSTDKQKLVN